MILVLRGHIRNSFNDDRLYNFIKQLHINFDITIYIHTWNIVQNNLSYRQLEEITTPVTRETFENYFKDLYRLIKYIIIDDDTEIELIGQTNGFIKNTSPGMPVRAWKNYWYGKYQIINYLHDCLIDRNEPIVNMRFDVLNNGAVRFNEKMIYLFIFNNRHCTFTKNTFIWEGEAGADNVHMGTIDTQYKLVRHFFYNMDDILEHAGGGNLKYHYHELYVPYENARLFN